ncbi:MAG TPA: TIGR02757 family protein [Coleofasciculaceae cyanobacterium]|jgi:uncharacterized protein (TIGR02757 family)
MSATKLEKPKSRARSAAAWLQLAPVMDALVAQYKTPAYILNDPIQIPHRFADDPKACELVAFITALFSYGRRDLIIETVTNLFRITDDDPVGFLESFNPKRDAKLFKHFVYRFNKSADVAYLWERLQWAYQEFDSLEGLFAHSARLDESEQSRLKAGIAGFTDQLLGEKPPQTYGLKFLFAHPDKGGACKRFNMFLRWMVRQDAEPSNSTRQDIDPTGRVDFGLWKNSLKPADLLVPLDTHILKMNRQLNLSARNDNSWKTAEEITDVFRLLCPEDPVKYDYALFGFSLDRRAPEEILRAPETASSAV